MAHPNTTSSAKDFAPRFSAGVTAQLEIPAPLVSIIIPAYNVAPFIGETLDSVFGQTCTDFEVILVNDGSPDTEEFERVLQPYRDRIRYLKQENSGASAARNAGLRGARGELRAFLDSYDLWAPQYLEQQLKFIREYGCDLACADAMIFGVSADAGHSYMESLMESAPAERLVAVVALV